MDSLLGIGIFAGEGQSGSEGEPGGGSGRARQGTRRNLRADESCDGKGFPDFAEDSERAAIIRTGKPRIHLRHLVGKEHLQQEIGIIGKGEQYHCISMGDLDMMAYLKFILQQRRVEYILISTWQFSSDDIETLCEYKDRGTLKRLDFYCGDAIGESRRTAFYFLLSRRDRKERVAWIFNHSKVLLAAGEGYYFTIEGSGNLNTTKRIEQCCITEDRDLFLFYKGFFDGLTNLKNPAENAGFEPYPIT